MANALAAILGPLGGLATCACCFLVAAIWGIFITIIPLAAYTKGWKDAIRRARGLDINNNGAVEMFTSHALLIGILCVYGYFGLRRALRSTN